MPPRFVYWTIVIDDLPTAFRARTRQELLPTLHQIQRRHPTATLRWFAHGRLWTSPEAARRWSRAARTERKPGKPPRGEGGDQGQRRHDRSRGGSARTPRHRQ